MATKPERWYCKYCEHYDSESLKCNKFGINVKPNRYCLGSFKEKKIMKSKEI